MNKINTCPDEHGVVLNLEEAVAYSRRMTTALAEERSGRVI
jgi:hypothetical protein